MSNGNGTGGLEKLGGQDLLKALAVALLLPITVVCTALTIYFPNSSELGIDLASVLTVSLIFLVLTAVVLFVVQLPFVYLLKGKCFAFVNAFVLVAGFWFWVQANVFNWDMGPLIGRIPFARFERVAYLEFGVWIALMVLAVVLFRFLSRYSIQFACILVATQIVGLAPFAFKGSQTGGQLSSNFARYEYTLNHFFDYSQDKDVYIFVLDTFGSAIFDELLTDYHEKYYYEFKDFTYFPKHLVYNPIATRWSIPRILTGIDTQNNTVSGFAQTPELQAHFHAAFSQKTLFDYATENGYKCQVFTWAPSTQYWNPQSISNIRKLENDGVGTSLFALRMSRFVGLTIFRLLPLPLKWLGNENGLLAGDLLISRRTREKILDGEYLPLFFPIDDIRFFEKSQSVEWNFTPDQKQLKFIFLQGAHLPFFMDENAERLPPLTTMERRDYALARNQARGTLKIVQSILEKMKEHGTYDNSLIVIMSDHGAQSSQVSGSVRAIMNKPLLLVKRPMDRHETMQINYNPVNLSDTTPAILVELGLDTSEISTFRNLPAFSWFDVPEDIAEQRNAEWATYFTD